MTKTRFLSTATPLRLGVLLDRILLLRAGVRLDRLPRGPVAHRDRSARRVRADRRLRIRGRTDQSLDLPGLAGRRLLDVLGRDVALALLGDGLKRLDEHVGRRVT